MRLTQREINNKIHATSNNILASKRSSIIGKSITATELTKSIFLKSCFERKILYISAVEEGNYLVNVIAECFFIRKQQITLLLLLIMPMKTVEKFKILNNKTRLPI